MKILFYLSTKMWIYFSISELPIHAPTMQQRESINTLKSNSNPHSKHFRAASCHVYIYFFPFYCCFPFFVFTRRLLLRTEKQVNNAPFSSSSDEEEKYANSHHGRFHDLGKPINNCALLHTT